MQPLLSFSFLDVDPDVELEVKKANNPDYNKIVHNWRAIADAFSTILEACNQEKTNEFSIRRGVDQLLERSKGVTQGTIVR